MISEVGRSYIDGKKVEGLSTEIQKLRRKIAGQERFFYLRRRTYENDAEDWKIDMEKPINDARREECFYDLMKTHLDEVLHTCGIEVSEQYKLKSELKK